MTKILDPLEQPIVVDTWSEKYRYRDEPDWAATCVRVASALCRNDHPDFRDEARRAMVAREIIPAGRILAGAGTDKRVTLVNCFVGPLVQDSMATEPGLLGKGIMDALSDSAYSLQMGGGIGTDFSTVRPRGALVKRTASVSSGVLPFMDMWHYMSETIMSAGHRRGAMMATLRCLDGSTRIHTVNGNIEIKKLVGQRPFVFACDPKRRRVHVVQADKVFVSDRNRRMLRLRFDNRAELVCTPDHLVMLRSGAYKAAEDLRVGDRLMAIEHGAAGYREMPNGSNRVAETVKCTGRGRKEYVYRLVAEDILLKKPDAYNVQIHHVDEDRLNSDPSNLEALTVSEHGKAHAGNARRNVIAIAEYRKGKTWQDVYGLEWAAERRRKQSDALKRAWAEGRMDHRRPPRSKANNHRIIAIEDAGVASKVYDIALPKWHNFAANEVFVHNCDHPDIEEFIEAKHQPGRLTNFNVSVLITDAFMRAVESDSHWHLVFDVPPAVDSSPAPILEDRGKFEHSGSGTLGYVYKTLRARDLWGKIIGSTYIHAEPGVIFIDRVNELNNLQYCEEINASNPCGEQMLPANGCCNLGHTNLAVMVDRPFEPGAEFRFDKLQTAARTMVRLLDNVLDETRWPTPEQAEEARLKRRIGLGFTGLATALQQLGIPYGSEQAVGFTREVTRRQAISAYWASVELARERGPFPLYDRDKFLAAPFVRKLPEDLRAAIAEYGIRNGVLLSIAPTGTTSLVLGNISSGIEPVFAHRYRRKVRGGHGQMEDEYSVYDYGYLKFCQMKGHDPELSHEWEGVTAGQLTVEQHLQMTAAAQEWVDSAVSKTINCPTSMTFEEFQKVYARAYELGLKGCTTYRPDPRSARGAVLTAEVPEDREEVIQSGEGSKEVCSGEEAREGGKARSDEEVRCEGEKEVARSAPLFDKIPMQDVVNGRRYRIKWPTEDCAYYVIITDYADSNGRRRPFELFISTKSERHSEWVRAFSLLVTAIFRREGDPTFVVDELRSVFSAAGGAWVRVPWADRPKLAPSLVAAVGLKIEEHMRWLGLIAPDEVLAPGHTDLMASPGAIEGALERAEESVPAAELLDVCIHCGARAVIYSEGCSTCHACGRSDCG